jgi:hypothetical protein
MFDKDGSGNITAPELKRVMQQLGEVNTVIDRLIGAPSLRTRTHTNARETKMRANEKHGFFRKITMILVHNSRT